MKANEYLEKVLESQNLDDDSAELKQLQDERAAVEKLLRKEFGSSPTIRYGGSRAKGTLILEAYDLDIISYFPRDDADAGGTLEDIYNNVRNALQKQYAVEAKASALRVRSKDPAKYGTDLRIDVVPGRFTDDSKGDAFLYRASGEKRRLKTNLDVHIKHVKDSGVIDAIRLMKLWRVRNALTIRHFALELLTIELLKGRNTHSLEKQLQHIWEELRDNVQDVSIEDPANPQGNDLSELLDDSIRAEISSLAGKTMKLIEERGWEAVFGELAGASREIKVESLRRMAAGVQTPSKPWCA